MWCIFITAATCTRKCRFYILFFLYSLTFPLISVLTDELLHVLSNQVAESGTHTSFQKTSRGTSEIETLVREHGERYTVQCIRISDPRLNKLNPHILGHTAALCWLRFCFPIATECLFSVYGHHYPYKRAMSNPLDGCVRNPVL